MTTPSPTPSSCAGFSHQAQQLEEQAQSALESLESGYSLDSLDSLDAHLDAVRNYNQHLMACIAALDS